MVDAKSDPILMEELVNGLQVWQLGTTSAGSTTASQKQETLGWDVLLDGWLSIEWCMQQETYWSTWQWKKSSKWWVSELIKKLWNVSWDMWEHWNGILHSSTQTQEEILDSQINEQLTALYNHGVQDVPQDAFMFF